MAIRAQPAASICQLPLHPLPRSYLASWGRRSLSTTPHIAFKKKSPGSGLIAEDLAKFMAQPTWSVRSLLPNDKSVAEIPVLTDELRHLRRLSALPYHRTLESRSKASSVLTSQLHFVRDIQSVDTSGVDPLRSIRDETSEGIREQTIGMERLQAALRQETTFGHNRRPRRQKEKNADMSGIEDWDVLGKASQRAGRYFVVKGGGKSVGP